LENGITYPMLAMTDPIREEAGYPILVQKAFPGPGLLPIRAGGQETATYFGKCTLAKPIQTEFVEGGN
jgi:hypothetical protein